nr:hypothetical protein [Tanacetum cinerariifolium]
MFDSGPLQKVSNNDNYNVFAIKSAHPEQSKYVHDTYPIEQDEYNMIIDSLDMSYDREQIDHDDDDDLANERELLASLIEKLKCEINDSKNRNKFLETSNKVLVDKLKELDRRNDVKYASKMEIDCVKAKRDLMSYKMESEKSFNAYTQKINYLNQMILEMKKELFAHQETISILSQVKEAQIKIYQTREDKELDKVIALENKVKVLDNIVYQNGQSVQTMNMLNRNYKTSFAKPEFLKKAQSTNPRLYDISCYNDNLALMLDPESDEVIRLEKESRSKLSDLIRPFDCEKLNNLYDLFVPQREKSSAQRYFSERSVGTIFDGVERCKETIVKQTYFGHIDPFIQNTIEAKFCPEIQKINADLEKFHLCLKEEMIADLRYFNSLELEVDSLKSQLETQKTQFLNEIDLLSREYYYADHMNAILGVYTELDEVTNLQYKNDKSFKENQSKEFRKEREQYFEIQDLKAQLQDKGITISELKKLIEKLKGKSVDTKFEKSSVIRQQNAFKSQRPSILGKPTIFSDSLERKDFSKSRSVTKNNVSNDFSKPVTAQILPPNKKSILMNTDVLAPGIPLLKSNQMEDRVMLNNSQGKKQDVEVHCRNDKLSKNKTSVTACNDSLNTKTSNVNFICATCGKCVLNEKHDKCVLKSLNGMNSRKIIPIDVPVSTREPKRIINKSVAKPLRRTVASESTNQKPRHTTRKLYEHVTKTCSWRVYYVEGLNHNLFSVGQLCDADLEVTFWKSTCCIRDLKGNDLLTAWLWHRHLSYLNFDTINLLSKNDIVIGLPKLKFFKDHLCSSCELGKAKRKGLHVQVRIVRTEKGMEFLNKTLHAYFASEGILHQTFVSRTPKQNGIVERQNRTLVEAARTMISAAKVPLFFWAKAIATSCFT